MATIDKHVTHELVWLEAGMPCSEAARLMAAGNIGSVGVRRGERIVGLVTERDLVARVLAGGAPADLPVGEAMRADIPAVTPETSETACLALMRDHGTRHLLVTQGATTVGVISMRDLVRLMLEEKEWLIGQLQSFIEGHDGPRSNAPPSA